MLRAAKPPFRRGFACGKTLVRRKSGAALKGRWARFKMVRPKFEISRLAKKKDTTHVVSFFLGSGRRRRPPPFGIEMLRAAKPFLRKVFSLAKTLYGAHAPPALQAGLEILSLRVYFMAHAPSDWLGPFLPCCASPPAASSIRAAAQTKWSCLICSIRWMTGTPKGHLFSQLPQAMQSSAFAGSAR